MISILKRKTETSRYHQVYSNSTLLHAVRLISEGSRSGRGIGLRMAARHTFNASLLNCLKATI